MRELRCATCGALFWTVVAADNHRIYTGGHLSIGTGKTAKRTEPTS